MPTLKFTIPTEAELPADHKSLYVERDGAWYLDVEGVVPKERLEEFRTNNRNLTKENAELKKKIADIDFDDIEDLKAKRKEIEDGHIKGKKAEEILEQRTKEMKAAHDKALTAEKARAEKAEGDLARLKINDAALSVAMKKGLLPSATEDLTVRAQAVFKLKDGKPTAFQGEAELYGISGGPLTVEEWVDGLTKNAPHLFKSSTGGGAGGAGSGGGATGGPNPFSKDGFNLTRQAELLTSDPAAAKRLAAAAGVSLR